MGFFQDLFGDTAAQAATDAAKAKNTALDTAWTQQQPYYTGAVSDIKSGFGGAQDTLTPLYNAGVSGVGAYADITGANGVAGQDRARALFQTDPGYQFAMDQALQATQRATGTGGFQDSGNVLTALQDRASGLAQQQYGNYVARLQPFLQFGLGAGGALAGSQATEGTTLAGAGLNEGQLGYNTTTGEGANTAAGILGAAQAKTAAAGNIANLGTKLLGFALAPATGGASLASTFGGGNEFGISDDELYGVGARALQA